MSQSTAFINVVEAGILSVNELLPINITMSDVPATPDTNVLVSATRYDAADPDDAGLSIASGGCGVSANIVSINDLFPGAEAAAAGRYRVRLILRNAAATYKQEANVMIEVLG